MCSLGSKSMLQESKHILSYNFRACFDAVVAFFCPRRPSEDPRGVASRLRRVSAARFPPHVALHGTGAGALNTICPGYTHRHRISMSKLPESVPQKPSPI